MCRFGCIEIRFAQVRRRGQGGHMEVRSKNKLIKLLSIAIFAASVATLSTSASSQRRGRNLDGYPNWGGSFDLRQTALNAGYNEGSKEGRKDYDKRTSHQYDDFKAYRNADQDYSSKFGDKNLYQ